ncbi:hypothetical protein OAT16_01600 [Prolixibacteraceae bacterium]|nr:hypothetical protein [Prolixibacteraceae bacterium]
MELEDLKNNWKALSEKEDRIEKVSVKELDGIIHTKGVTQFAKIEKSIRVAYILVVLFWILQFALDFFIVYYMHVKLPLFLSIVDYGLAVLCSVALLSFVYKVNKIAWHTIPSSQVKSSINKFLFVLKKFKRSYFFCVFSLLLSGALGTVYSIYESIIEDRNIIVNNGDKLFLLIYIVTSIIIFVTVFFLARRLYVWVFDLLFGKHMTRLEELNEEINTIAQ